MAAPDPAPGLAGELFPHPREDIRRGLEGLLPLIEKVFPLPARFRRNLGDDVAELSRLLTSARGERALSYLNRPPLLSAYLRYFLPWNVYRLCRLLPGLELPLVPGDLIVDLGSGPLSFCIALWICRRDLRALPLEFHCRDRSKAALEAGKKLFAALSGADCLWTVRTVQRELGQSAGRGKRPGREAGPEAEGSGAAVGLGGGGEKSAALVTVLNVYNEFFQPISPGDDESLRRFAGAQARLLAAMAGREGRVLILEPGVPRSGRFITLLREALIKTGRPPLSPCVHAGPCPFPALKNSRAGKGWTPARQGDRLSSDPGGSAWGGQKVGGDGEKAAAKWCHFAFDTGDAPAALRRLSEAAGIPKERAALCFLLAGPETGGPPAGGSPAGGGSASGPPATGSPAGGGSAGGPPATGSPAGGGSAAVLVRIISDPFPLGGGRGALVWGRYGCCDRGMALLEGERGLLESCPAGVLVQAVFPGRRDPKSGALVCHAPEGAGMVFFDGS
jgi:hypothetical protein